VYSCLDGRVNDSSASLKSAIEVAAGNDTVPAMFRLLDDRDIKLDTQCVDIERGLRLLLLFFFVRIVLQLEV